MLGAVDLLLLQACRLSGRAGSSTSAHGNPLPYAAPHRCLTWPGRMYLSIVCVSGHRHISRNLIVAAVDYEAYTHELSYINEFFYS